MINEKYLVNKCNNEIERLNRFFASGNSYKSSFNSGYISQPSEDIIESPDLWDTYNWRWFRYAYKDEQIDNKVNLYTPYLNEKGKFMIYFGQELGDDYDRFLVGQISISESFLYNNKLTFLRGQQLWNKLIDRGYSRTDCSTDFRPCLGFCWFVQKGGIKVLHTCSNASVFKCYGCVNLNKKYQY